MASVYFSDADKVVHQLPSELTHFEPNDESDPYVLDKLTVTHASGRVTERRVDGKYFDALANFLDEASPTFMAAGKRSASVCAADFVRFVGTPKTATVIANMWLHAFRGSISTVMYATSGSPFHHIVGDITATYYASAMIIRGDISSHECRDQDSYVATMLFIPNVCEHTRDMIDYVRTSTNELYAKRLDGFLVQIDKLLADLNPTGYLFAMKWLMNDFDKIPRRIRDGWLGYA